MDSSRGAEVDPGDVANVSLPRLHNLNQSILDIPQSRRTRQLFLPLGNGQTNVIRLVYKTASFVCWLSLPPLFGIVTRHTSHELLEKREGAYRLGVGKQSQKNSRKQSAGLPDASLLETPLRGARVAQSEEAPFARGF